MRIDTGQHLRLDQRMKLAPRMIQSMEILQLPMLALEERIEQELSANPTLELREVRDDAQEIEAQTTQDERDASEGERQLVVEDSEGGHTDDFERLSNLAEEYGESWSANNYESDSFRPSRVSTSGERDGKMDAMANTTARPQGMCDQLLAQWAMVECDDRTRDAGEFLIAQIDGDGYLRQSLEALLPQTPPHLELEDLQKALPLLQQSLEPAGLAATNLRQCLLLQIDAAVARGDVAEEDLKNARMLVSDHLKDIEMNHMPRIAKETGLSIEQIKQALLQLRRFQPHPGRMLVTDMSARITPDATVEYDEHEDRYVARLTRDRTPSLMINPRYMKMIKDRQIDKKTRDFVSNNLRSAQWLIDAIQQRESTLLRVINVVLEAQRDYFDLGPQHLKPLPMTSVADQLGIHVATVSRAVSEKYLQTPRGVVPLRMFFSGGTETESGDAMSWSAVQAKLEQVIANEDKTKPLNDDELAEKLKEQGIEIARRTVAKYRKQLNIGSARSRREYAS